MQPQIWPDSGTVRRRPRQTVAHIPTRFRRPPGFRSTICQLDFPSRYCPGNRAHSDERFDVRTSDRFIAQPRDQYGVYINPRQSRQKTRFFRVPKLALKITQGEVTNVVLASVRMQPSVLTESGFVFDHADLATALAWALNDY